MFSVMRKDSNLTKVVVATRATERAAMLAQQSEVARMTLDKWRKISDHGGVVTFVRENTFNRDTSYLWIEESQ